MPVDLTTRWLPALLLLGAVSVSAGCRDHPQQAGRYELHEVALVLDTCGLWASGALRPRTVMLSVPGNEVFAELSSPVISMWGRFLWEGEHFRVAGSLADTLLGEEGSCELSLLQAVLEARTETTQSPPGQRFTGRLTLETQGRFDAACDCWTEVEIEGVLDTD